MRFNGVALSTATAIYLAATGNFGPGEIIVYVTYTAFCLAVFADILRRPQACNARRIVAIIGDCSVLASEMCLRGESTAFLFPLLIWVILGNGFRFGLRFLALATTGGLVAFGTVIAATPFWQSEPAVSAGLIAGLLLAPIAAAPLIRKLSQAKRQAEAANEAKSFLLASVSHELRTPLTAILGTGSVLQDTKLDPAQQEITRRVISAGERLRTLVDGLSDATWIEEGHRRRPEDPRPSPAPTDGGT
ncbi:histidine kinase dimerization/phospho-acceptor domain-containing protein [Inquilinus limosus]|nr:histidine kinase dimerization/phospho-acceptor domain-containing protein [Inquilinus limosus]